MELVADATLPFPRDLVFAAYRDELTKLLKYLPNVRDIVVKSRKEDGARVELVNLWHGGGEGGTRIEIRGNLRIDAKKIRGVPGFLAGRVAGAVESFLAAKIKPNLVEVTEGLHKHLAACAG